MTTIPTLDDLMWKRLFFAVGAAIELVRDEDERDSTAAAVERGDIAFTPEDRGLVVFVAGEPLVTAAWSYLMHGDAASSN